MKKLNFTSWSTWLLLLLIMLVLLSGIPFLVFYWSDAFPAIKSVAEGAVSIIEITFVGALFCTMTFGLMFPIGIGERLIKFIKIFVCTIQCIKDLPEPI